MYEFAYHKPATLAEAAAALRKAVDGKLLAGGMTLIPTLKLRLARPSDLIDLDAVADLKGIRREGETLAIGAMTAHAAVARSCTVRSAIPTLADLAGGIGDRAVRSRGTIGGTIVNNDPAADYPAALLGLGSTIATDRRMIAADAFFTGMFETALDPGEIVTAVRFPIPARAAYVKFANPISRYAVVGVFVAATASGVRVAVTGAAACVFRHAEMERALSVNFAPEALNGISTPENNMNSDIHAGAAYRAHLVGVIAKRAVAACR